jgi:hypothetical protein
MRRTLETLDAELRDARKTVTAAKATLRRAEAHRALLRASIARTARLIDVLEGRDPSETDERAEED